MANKHNKSPRGAGIPVVKPPVAGIDIGGRQHWVCAPALAGASRELQVCGATTAELEKLAAELQQRQVGSVAMESTGVYWIPPHEILERRRCEVLLVNTRDLARAPGRTKTGRHDCMWIQRLHSCGLLRGAFRPAQQTCLLRILVRDKGNLVAQRSDWLRRMRKSLDQMNVRVQRAVAKSDGVSGMAIIRAIVAGERDPRQLAQLRHARCRKSEQQIAQQLSGHWRQDHLFSLGQALKMQDSIQERIQEYEQEILRQLAEMEQPDCQGQAAPELNNKQKARTISKRGQEPLHQALYRAAGVDLTGIDALGVETVQVVLSEYGADLSRFPGEHEFVSHLKLVPYKPLSGGKPVKKKKKRGSASTRVGEALRMAVLSLRHGKTALGAY